MNAIWLENSLVLCFNNCTIMNIWFQKKTNPYWHFDSPCNQELPYGSHRAYCRDVQVMKGANGSNDHKLAKAKLNIKLPRYADKNKFCVSFAVHELSSCVKRDEYCKVSERELSGNSHFADDTSEHNWSLALCQQLRNQLAEGNKSRQNGLKRARSFWCL